MPQLRSRTTTHGRNMAGARALWRATGMGEDDFGKPIIAIANSYTQFVPGHVHLKDLGDIVAEKIKEAGGVSKEFNTIAVDDGIAMGHGGMLYSLPSREIIADSIEYMANAHCADALVCISNCDKITPGMLLAAMRLNIPVVFVSGGPMEAGKVIMDGEEKALDLVDAMVAGADERVSDEDAEAYERSACPTCGSCSGMFTANSMNCLTEALGLSLPGNGSTLATHADRRALFERAGTLIVDLAKRYYHNDDESVLPRNIASFKAFENAMRLDIAMGGSTNTILHLLAVAREAACDFTLDDINRLSLDTPCLCKVAPAVPHYHMEDVHRAGGIMSLLKELDRGGLLHRDLPTVHSATLGEAIDYWDITNDANEAALTLYSAAPGGVRTTQAFSQSRRWDSLDTDREAGCIRSLQHAYTTEGGLAVLYGNLSPDGCIVKTAGVDEFLWSFSGPAVIFESQDDAVSGILGGKGKSRRCGHYSLRRTTWWAGHARDVVPDQLSEVEGLGSGMCFDYRWAFSGGTSGLSIGHVSPEAGEGGNIALVEPGDTVEIDIPQRLIRIAISDEELAARRAAMEAKGDQAWKPVGRVRPVSAALRAYASMTTSADKGAVRIVPE